MSRAVYLKLKGGDGPMPWQWLRATVCERMHWTFAEYDATTTRDIYELLQVWDATQKAGAK